MDWHKYPDPGGIASDRERLEFAVHFATAQRASTARRIYSAATAGAADDDLIFLAVDVMEEKMQAVEDTLGWLSALDRWIPDGRSLFPLLDRVRVEREEEALGRLLENLDEDGLRRILRVRPDDLDEASLPAPIRLRIEQSIPALLAGLARVLEFRTANGRRTVRMFNKAKHMLQGVVFGGRDGTRAFELISGTPPERIGRVVATADNVRTLAAETIVMQAVLHGMLATVLMVHYEHRYVSPPWVVDALGLPAGWHDGPEVARLVRA